MKRAYYFSDQEMDYIGGVLGQRPWAEVNALMASIIQQANAPQPEEKHHAGKKRRTTAANGSGLAGSETGQGKGDPLVGRA